jgi:Lipocalin-like domain
MHPADSEDQPGIHGVWQLASYYVENLRTAERTEVFGPNPKGVLILLPEGRMTAMLTPTNRKQPATEKAQADAFRNLIAYSGMYRLEPPDRFVTTVDIAWFEPWVGSRQPRRFTLRDDVLEITSGPKQEPLMGDEPMLAVLQWVRESSVAPQISSRVA